MKRTDYRWPETVAVLLKYPGLWRMTHQNVPVKAARRVRLRQHPALVVDGIIEARVTNPYRDDEGEERGTLWLRYTPPQKGSPRETEEAPAQPGGEEATQ